METLDFVKNFSYRILFERVFDPIALYRIEDEHIIFVDINPSYERVMKQKRSEIIGRTFHEVWPKAERRWSQVITECLKQKRTMHCIGESSDAKSYLEAIAFPIPPEMAAVIFLDRTKLKRSDNALRKRQMQLRAMATQLTISEEKTKRTIASYLHDKIGYDLITQLNILRNINSCDEAKDFRDSIQELIAITENIIAENRDLIFELSPPVLKEAGLNPALEELAEKILTPHKIQWHVITKGSANEFMVDDSVCVILYRMARELMINVVKHSGASTVNIIINRKLEIITVAVEDNGNGFDTAQRGFGLFSIRERLLALGGELRIISEIGEGTMAIMSCPRKLKDGEFT